MQYKSLENLIEPAILAEIDNDSQANLLKKLNEWLEYANPSPDKEFGIMPPDFNARKHGYFNWASWKYVTTLHANDKNYYHLCLKIVK